MSEESLRFTLLGQLWRYHPRGLRSWETPWPEGRALADLLSEIGIPKDQVMVILVNGARRDWAYCPQRGDHVEVLPVVDGG